MPVGTLLKSAIAAHKEGRIEQAASLYLDVLRAEPNNSNALNLVGVTYQQLGDSAKALKNFEKAIAVRPANYAYWLSAAECVRSSGQLAKALRYCKRAIDLNPAAETFVALADIYKDWGDNRRSIEELRRAVKLNPVHLPAHERLVDAFLRIGSFKDAEDGARWALTQFSARSLPDERLGALHGRLSSALSKLGQIAGALSHAERASALRPSCIRSKLQVGHLSLLCNLPDRAREAAIAAMRIDVTSVPARLLAVTAAERMGKVSAALSILEDSVANESATWELLAARGRILLQSLEQGEAVCALRRALQLNPHHPVLHQCLILALNYPSGQVEEEIVAEHRSWALHSFGNMDVYRLLPQRRRDQRPRIGYLSPDLCEHSVARFMEPVLRHHDYTRYDVAVFCDVEHPDAVTTQLKSLVPKWVAVSTLSDEELFQCLEEHELDILIELSGHTARNRLLALARKPARVQVSYLGYPNTTGMPRDVFEYRLTDGMADPVGNEKWYNEELVRLPGTFLCYAPPQGTPRVDPPPALANGYFTFGCFANLMKVTTDLIAMWASVLRALDNSRIVLKSRPLVDPMICDRILGLMSEAGIAANRVRLIGFDTGADAHWSRYREVDVILDTFPYNGTTTTCEALWMGVPVVTLAGASHRSRVGCSLLHSVGLENMVARSAEEYVQICERTGRDLSYLRSIRKTLREQMLRSRLMDGLVFTQCLEKSYQEMWYRANGASEGRS